MDVISVKDIVFVAFPFSDLSQTKLRPALVLANAQRNDWILCQITSQAYNDSQAVALDAADFQNGFLSKVSYVRPHKIFTANEQLIKKQVASLTAAKHHEIITRIQKILHDGH
ncbi:Transcriptional modulator of MazE/toxin, MazF [Crenothrix polyspora]|uniref:Transcriptional modulator of MazE/toxin, MazF n=1 Tax=Crenothrix polyspora TaxID=360316 RepID=A0A1R4H3P8_9GAMM|nr:type II toxin-antitoxin system PemK/MazF family toxin [Crenothrix polyspora]SJM90872.1 Transcriptional modulator of MazE/toxin, MazF [Crenothrix polyspora]